MVTPSRKILDTGRHEILFASLTGLAVKGAVRKGDTLHITTRWNTNLKPQTIEGARKAENHPFESAGHSPGRNGTHGLTSNEHYVSCWTPTTATSCTDASVALPAAACSAWVELFDATKGTNWKNTLAQQIQIDDFLPCGYFFHSWHTE
jgi:hypothetical protein